MTESDLNKFGRTKADADDKIPLDFKYVKSNVNDVTYDNFKDCYEAIRKGKTSASDEVKKVYEDVTNDPGFQTGIQFINFFETEYACSGVCKSALFFYQLSL